jgi:hypothetical protein
MYPRLKKLKTIRHQFIRTVVTGWCKKKKVVEEKSKKIRPPRNSCPSIFAATPTKDLMKLRRLGLLFLFVFIFAFVSVFSIFLAINSSRSRREARRNDVSPLFNRKPVWRSEEEKKISEGRFQEKMKDFVKEERDPNTEFFLFGNSSAPRMGLLIPFRPRDEYEEKRLSEFLWYMHWFFFSRTHLRYRLIVLEQEDGKPFNRAKLLNVGFLITKEHFDYYVFHDLDERPWSRVDYTIPTPGEPVHMMTARSRYNYSPVSMEADPFYTGGVLKITTQDFAKVNGFSDLFWGWGHEDRDFGHRIWNSGLTLKRLNEAIGRFRSTPEQEHGHRDKDFDEANVSLVNKTTDGLSSTTFEVLSSSHSQHHSRYLVHI